MAELKFGQLYQYVVSCLPNWRLYEQALSLCGELLSLWTLDITPAQEGEIRHAVTTVVSATGACPAGIIDLPTHITKHLRAYCRYGWKMMNENLLMGIFN